jgi:hypothetical protein
MGEDAEKVGQMIIEEAAQWRTVNRQCDPSDDEDTIMGLARIYPPMVESVEYRRGPEESD